MSELYGLLLELLQKVFPYLYRIIQAMYTASRIVKTIQRHFQIRAL